jgi:hypothetical protein
MVKGDAEGEAVATVGVASNLTAALHAPTGRIVESATVVAGLLHGHPSSR